MKRAWEKEAKEKLAKIQESLSTIQIATPSQQPQKKDSKS
jgi:hypothetical protein